MATHGLELINSQVITHRYMCNGMHNVRASSYSIVVVPVEARVGIEQSDANAGSRYPAASWRITKAVRDLLVTVFLQVE